MSKHPAGKGSKYRPVDKKQYDKNYDAIFKKPKKKKLYQTKHTLCYELYEKGGAKAVIDYCISIDHCEWAYCPDCEEAAPIEFDNTCLICGQITPRPEFNEGDIVYYNDPEDSLLSCHGTIIEIHSLFPDAVVTLNTMLHGGIECSLSELTKVK
jgi:hypothetical protein